MSKANGGAQPMGYTSNTNPDNSNPNGSDHRQGRANRGRHSGHESRFKGKCFELRKAVYDIVAGKDTFLKTTREIAEYVGRNFDDAGEFRTGMPELQLLPLAVPAQPDDTADAFVMEI